MSHCTYWILTLESEFTLSEWGKGVSGDSLKRASTSFTADSGSMVIAVNFKTGMTNNRLSPFHSLSTASWEHLEVEGTDDLVVGFGYDSERMLGTTTTQIISLKDALNVPGLIRNLSSYEPWLQMISWWVGR